MNPILTFSGGHMRPGVVLLALWTVVNLLMTVRLARPSRPADLSADGRTPIQLPMEARDLVLAEMRTMLGSVQGVLDGAARSDTAAIRTAAAASGLVMAADPLLERVLPKAFLQLGMLTHTAFDTLATHAGSGPASAIKGLVGITSSCVACHATYRLEVR
jgi:cytochrome c556